MTVLKHLLWSPLVFVRPIARSVFPASVMVLFLLCVELAAQPSVTTLSADLRVYGKVKTAFSPDRAVFECGDARHADILMGKLLADLFWNAGSQVKANEIRIGGHSLMVREWPPYGAILVVRSGNSVLALGGGSAAEVAQRARDEALLHADAVTTAPEQPYPQTLDYYDLKAFKFYTHAMRSMLKLGLDSHWPFVHSMGLDSLSFQDLNISYSSPAPGVVQWTPSDYEVREAENQNGMMVPSVTVAGVVPFWLRNQFPGAIAQPDPSALMNAWAGPTGANAYCQSWGTPLDVQRDYSLSFLKQTIKRYGNSPAIGGWQIYAGEPGAEFGFHDRVTENLDYSPMGQESFRNYLRRVKGYGLADLGRRWYGDPARFASWQQVSIPDLHGFFGDLNDKSFRIDTGWSWLLKDKASASPGPVPPPSAAWLPAEMPPSQQQVTLPWGAAYYKVRFDPGAWTEARAGKQIYLVCDVGVRNATHVWLNGKDLGERKSLSGAGYGPFSLDVTGLLQTGANELVLLVPGDGKMIGPAFLTTTQPAFYPNLGTGRNAQYVDAKEWQPYSLYALHDTVLREARHLDPDRAITVASEVLGKASLLAQDYGASVQMTGREAWYYPWAAGLGYVDHFYSTSESSATPTLPDLTRMLSWILYDSDSSTMLYYDLEGFEKYEKESGWFSRHRGAYRLEGKALPVRPQIALLSSVTTGLLDSMPWPWDLRFHGDLPSVHYDNVYVTEAEILNGKVDAYPILFDSGSLYLDPNVIAAIRRYVEAGGTFIALHNTGWHTTTEPDSFPISQLTGFRVTATNKSGSIRFSNSTSLFKNWNGETNGTGLALEPQSPDAVSLAKWADGSTAIGSRTLGKGRVILLGSTFWRSPEALDRLLTDLGVARTTNSDSPRIWTRKFITKNGLQEWLIAINSGTGSVTGSVSMTVDKQPGQVWDIVSGSTVPFTYANGQVTIANVGIPERENRVFGVQRTSLAGGIPTWWEEKLSYWQSTALAGSAVSMASSDPMKPADPSGLQTVSADQWKVRALTEEAAPLDAGWQIPGYDDHAWLDMKSGPWSFQTEQLKNFKGMALYRFRFQAPAAWSGHRVVLGLYSQDGPIVYDHGVFALNGQPVASYDAGPHDTETYNYDVTDQLKPGENVLSITVKGGVEFGGPAGAIWLAAEPKLEEAKEMIAGWQVVARDRKTTQPASLPGKAHGSYIFREINLPASFRGKNVFLHLEMPYQWLGLVLVNGHPLYNFPGGQNYGTRVDINLSPFYKVDQPNRIELWPFSTEPRGPGVSQSEEADMNLSVVRIGYQGDASEAHGSQ